MNSAPAFSLFSLVRTLSSLAGCPLAAKSGKYPVVIFITEPRVECSCAVKKRNYHTYTSYRTGTSVDDGKARGKD